VLLVTFGLTVFYDLTVGIAAGVALAIARHLLRKSPASA
jgi:MFS superfamily sulfate permease-like transporter